MITLYGVARSRASRPLWLLGELGLAYDQIPVIQSYRLPDPQAADAPLNTASPAFIAINPQGQVPALKDGDLVLTESLGMTLYIAKAYGGDFGPRDAGEDALMTQYTLLAATAVEPHAVKILYAYAENRAQTPEGAAEVEAAATALARSFARLDAHFAAHAWLVGDRFTAADINLAECCRYAQPHPTLIAGYPHLAAWLARAQLRPAFGAMMALRNAEPA